MYNVLYVKHAFRVQLIHFLNGCCTKWNTIRAENTFTNTTADDQCVIILSFARGGFTYTIISHLGKSRYYRGYDIMCAC